MSLDLKLYGDQCTHCGSWPETKDFNITHNLTKMAHASGLYYTLWRPEEVGIRTAQDMQSRLEKGITLLEKYPEFYRKFNSVNGWGLYSNFVPFCKEVLQACYDFPSFKVDACR